MKINAECPYKVTAKFLAKQYGVSWRYLSTILCGVRRGDNNVKISNR